MAVRGPRLTITQILAWADAHHRRTGRWPSAGAGRIAGAGITWAAVESALARGHRGLPGGSSLSKVLDTYRRRPTRPRHRLTRKKILEWADEHCERTGRWPSARSGRVRAAPGERWDHIEGALRRGSRGLHDGSSLARLLVERRNKARHTNRPPRSPQEILALADEHFRRTGRWPTRMSGRVVGAPGETWLAIDKAMKRSGAEVRGFSSLAHLLTECRGTRSARYLPRLTIKQILEWADRHHRRTGRWPVHKSGPVPATAGETWANIDAALRVGNRGLRGDSSLATLLSRYRRVHHHLQKRPRLTIKQILEWADRHHRRRGSWPAKDSGAIYGSDGETWIRIEGALLCGRRGLPGGTTLVYLLAKHRGRPYRRKATDLTIKQILQWAEAHHRRTGNWPTQSSGPVRGVAGERWGNIQSALYKGSRALPGDSSLARLLDKHFGT